MLYSDAKRWGEVIGDCETVASQVKQTEKVKTRASVAAQEDHWPDV